MSKEHLSDYHYDLPPELIAQRPTARREDSRMLVVNRQSGTLTHANFRDFPSHVQAGDVVALNDSRVIKARLLSEDSRTECLLLEAEDPTTWKCLVRPGRKMRVGVSLPLAGTIAHVVGIYPGGERRVKFDSPPNLEQYGHLPIPPYFHRTSDAADDERYQTVYAKESGSIAAPTAGLHFTPEILAKIPHTFLTLHVGAGTFLPVKTDNLADHFMHEERYSIPRQTAEALNTATRTIAVGTTVMRVLESQLPGLLQERTGRTDIFIRPPFAFQHVGALLTNFHLPCSTLLMLVCAFAGYDVAMAAYAEAVRDKYRFFSYGDCMLIE